MAKKKIPARIQARRDDVAIFSDNLHQMTARQRDRNVGAHLDKLQKLATKLITAIDNAYLGEDMPPDEQTTKS